MLLDCETCQHMQTRVSDFELVLRTCPRHPGYIALFNLLDRNRPPATYIQDCPDYQEKPTHGEASDSRQHG